MNHEPQGDYTALYWPRRHDELLLIKPILDREGINYYVLNEFGALGTYSGIGNEALTVMVETRQVERCAAILREEVGLK